MAFPRVPSPPPPLSSLITKGSPHSVFQIGQKIGQGSCGAVYRAKHLPTQTEVAVKIIELSAMPNYTSVLAREIDLMSRCSSDHFVAFLGAWTTGRQVWIVSELMDGGSLSDFMAITGHTLFEREIGAVLKQCALALVQFHSERRIHRDVKAANILINSAGRAKLADVGVAAQLSSGQPSRRTAVGSPYWMAPEVATSDTEYNEKADIYSLAITAIELAHGEPPNSSMPPMQALQHLLASRPPKLDPAKGRWSPAIVDLIARCTARNPDVRPSATELLKHPFLADLETEECAEILSAMWRAWGEKVIQYRGLEARIQPINQSINHSLRAEESQSSLFFRDSGSDSPRSVSFSASRSFIPSASLYDRGSGPPSLSPTPINLTINQSNSQLSVAPRARSASFSESITFYDADTKVDDDETCTVIDYSQPVNSANQSTSQSTDHPSQSLDQSIGRSPDQLLKKPLSQLSRRDRQRSVANFLASTPTPASILARLDELRKAKHLSTNPSANQPNNPSKPNGHSNHRRLDSMPIIRYSVDRSNNQSTNAQSNNQSIIYVGPGRGSVSYPAYFDRSINQSANQSNNDSGDEDLSEENHRYCEPSSVVNSYDDELIEQSFNQSRNYDYQFTQSFNQANDRFDRFDTFDEDDEEPSAQVYNYSAAD